MRGATAEVICLTSRRDRQRLGPRGDLLGGPQDRDRPLHLFGDQPETTQDPAAVIETKGYIGERLDAAVGLEYLNARYYDPRMGMFLQPD